MQSKHAPMVSTEPCAVVLDNTACRNAVENMHGSSCAAGAPGSVCADPLQQLHGSEHAVVFLQETPAAVLRSSCPAQCTICSTALCSCAVWHFLPKKITTSHASAGVLQSSRVWLLPAHAYMISLASLPPASVFLTPRMTSAPCSAGCRTTSWSAQLPAPGLACEISTAPSSMNHVCLP